MRRSSPHSQRWMPAGAQTPRSPPRRASWRTSTARSTRPRCAATAGPAETTLRAWDGEAWGYLRRSRRTTAKLASRATIVAQLVHAGATVEPGRASLADARALQRTGFALTFPSDSALALPNAARPRWLNRDGFVSLPLGPTGEAAVPRLAGFRRASDDTLWPPRFAALAGGALQGRRIALDPEGGGDDAAGSGPGGTRASALNLEVARA